MQHSSLARVPPPRRANVSGSDAMVESATGGGVRTGRHFLRNAANSIHHGQDPIKDRGGVPPREMVHQFGPEVLTMYSSARPRTTESVQQSSAVGARRQSSGSMNQMLHSNGFRNLFSPVNDDWSHVARRQQPPALTRNFTLGDLRPTELRAAAAAAGSRPGKEVGDGDRATTANDRFFTHPGCQTGRTRRSHEGGMQGQEMVINSSGRPNMSDGTLERCASQLPLLEAFAGGGLRQAQQHRATVGTVENSVLSEHGISFGVSALKGRRLYMEDEFKVIPSLELMDGSGGDFMGEARQIDSTRFFGVFDGHAGGRCSRELTQTLAQTVSREPDFMSKLPQAVHRGFLKVNVEFLCKAERLCANDGSTAITAFVRGRYLVIGNVGDSRAVLCSSGRRAVPLSSDHKPNKPEERRRIHALGGRVVSSFGIPRVNGILAVSRAFGDRNIKGFISAEPEVRELLLEHGDDFLVLATDGLWDVITNQEACNIVYSAPDLGPQACAEMLTATAIRKGSMDNTTAMVVDLRGLWVRNGFGPGGPLSLHRRGGGVAFLASASPSGNINNRHHTQQQQQQQKLRSVSFASNPSVVTNREGVNTGVSDGARACAGGLGWSRPSSSSSLLLTSQQKKKNLNGLTREGSNATPTGWNRTASKECGGVGGRCVGGTSGGGDVSRGGGWDSRRIGSPQKLSRPLTGQLGAGGDQQNQQRHIHHEEVDAGREERATATRQQQLAPWVLRAPRAWQMDDSPVPAWSAAAGDGGRGGGRGGRGGGGHNMSAPRHANSTELAVGLNSGGRQPRSRTAFRRF